MKKSAAYARVLVALLRAVCPVFPPAKMSAAKSAFGGVAAAVILAFSAGAESARAEGAAIQIAPGDDWYIVANYPDADAAQDGVEAECEDAGNTFLDCSTAAISVTFTDEVFYLSTDPFAESDALYGTGSDVENAASNIVSACEVGSGDGFLAFDFDPLLACENAVFGIAVADTGVITRPNPPIFCGDGAASPASPATAPADFYSSINGTLALVTVSGGVATTINVLDGFTEQCSLAPTCTGEQTLIGNECVGTPACTGGALGGLDEDGNRVCIPTCADGSSLHSQTNFCIVDCEDTHVLLPDDHDDPLSPLSCQPREREDCLYYQTFVAAADGVGGTCRATTPADCDARGLVLSPVVPEAFSDSQVADILAALQIIGGPGVADGGELGEISSSTNSDGEVVFHIDGFPSLTRDELVELLAGSATGTRQHCVQPRSGDCITGQTFEPDDPANPGGVGTCRATESGDCSMYEVFENGDCAARTAEHCERGMVFAPLTEEVGIGGCTPGAANCQTETVVVPNSGGTCEVCAGGEEGYVDSSGVSFCASPLPTASSYNCERAGWEAYHVNDGTGDVIEVCGIPWRVTATVSVAGVGGVVGASTRQVGVGANEVSSDSNCISRMDSEFAVVVDVPPAPGAPNPPPQILPLQQELCNDDGLFGSQGLPMVPQGFDVAAGDELIVQIVPNGRNVIYFDSNGDGVITEDEAVARLGGSGGGGSPSSDSAARDAAYVFGGAMLAVAAFHFYTAATPGVFSFSPDVGYSFTESGYSYRYGGRMEYNADQWKLYWTTGQANNDGEFGEFRYASGATYRGEFWNAAFSESVQGDDTNYNVSLATQFGERIWRVSPTYRLSSSFDEFGESSTRNSLDLRAVLEYNRWKISPSAGFSWRRADEFGDSARFRVEAVHRF